MTKTADVYQGELFCLMDNPLLDPKDNAENLADLLAENIRLKRQVAELEDEVNKLQSQIEKIRWDNYARGCLK